VSFPGATAQTPSIFDTFPQSTFNGVAFPTESSRIEGGMRDHVHEYPHSPGGSPEKLGRKLYTFHVSAKFDTNFDNYPGLYPVNLDALLGFFEQGVTGDLRLSQMPSAVPSYAFQWTREQSAKCRSGEKVDIVFREDQSTLFLFADVVNASANGMAQASNSVAQELASIQAQIALTRSDQALFSGLAGSVGAILALQDQANLFDTRLNDQIASIQNTCSSLDVSPALQVAIAWPLVNAMHDLWFAAVQLGQKQQSNGVLLQTYVVPATTDIGQIANAIYKDTSRVSDLLTLNPVVDPMSIRAGTRIEYFPVQ
jgi:prophage DNA circulation protein